VRMLNKLAQDRLDPRIIPMADDKATAKQWAKDLGLKTYTYIRL
jgi:hypothetical protein